MSAINPYASGLFKMPTRKVVFLDIFGSYEETIIYFYGGFNAGDLVSWEHPIGNICHGMILHFIDNNLEGQHDIKHVFAQIKDTKLKPIKKRVDLLSHVKRKVP